MSAHLLRRDRYREWLAAQGAKFGFAEEIAAKASNIEAGVQNDTPPVEQWHKIVPTLRLVEQLREQFGPTIITSAYRSTAYNAAVKGESRSRHIQNDAIDLRCLSGTPEQWAAFFRDRRRQDAFSGGIGTYRTFVHIDTRGSNRDWTVL